MVFVLFFFCLLSDMRILLKFWKLEVETIFICVQTLSKSMHGGMFEESSLVVWSCHSSFCIAFQSILHTVARKISKIQIQWFVTPLYKTLQWLSLTLIIELQMPHAACKSAEVRAEVTQHPLFLCSQRAPACLLDLAACPVSLSFPPWPLLLISDLCGTGTVFLKYLLIWEAGRQIESGKEWRKVMDFIC